MGVTGIRLAAHDAQCSSIFPNVLTGKCKLAWAHEEDKKLEESKY
jgi:hypothetical protein